MAKSFEVTCPHCGETYLVEIPEPEKRRGQLYGISLADMTDDQLKREIINAGFRPVQGEAARRLRGCYRSQPGPSGRCQGREGKAPPRR